MHRSASNFPVTPECAFIMASLSFCHNEWGDLNVRSVKGVV